MRTMAWIGTACLALGTAWGAAPPVIELASVPGGGQSIPSTPDWQLRPGITIDLQFRADRPGSANLLTKEGEYLIRIDGTNEGGQLSIFLNLDGSWEPRLRTVVPVTGQWHRLTTSWDGSELVAVVDGQAYRQRRAGQVNAGDEPVVLAADSGRAAALQGELRRFRLFHRAVSEGELLAELLGLSTAVGEGRDVRRFRFADGPSGWVGRACVPSHQDEVLNVPVEGGQSAIVRTGLAVPLAGDEQVGVRMAVEKGTVGRLVLATDAGARSLAFDLLADGRQHSYLLPVDKLFEWQGTLRALALVPSDAHANVDLESIEIAAASSLPPEIAIAALHAEDAYLRAGRPEQVVAELVNRGGAGTGLAATLEGPPGVTIARPARQTRAAVAQGERWTVTWPVTAAAASSPVLELTVDGAGSTPVTEPLRLGFGAVLPVEHAAYVPPPQPAKVKDDLLIGAHMCPLWKTGERSQVWEPIVGWPNRKPVLGWYDEGSPEVTDWEIKWCLEHGIDYFVYCWYRARTGAPVEQRLSHGIHEGLFNARYGDQFKFAIMWENGNAAGVADEADLFDTLLPYWIETYFKRDNYLKVDGRPVLYIYRPEKLVQDLGNVAKVRAAFDKMRQVCRDAGFQGLWILGEYRGLSPEHLQLLADEGLDASFAYCWPLGGNPDSAKAVDLQQKIWDQRLALGKLPDILTVSMGWDSRPWHPSSTIWRLTPEDFQLACEQSIAAAKQRPAGTLGRRMILLDNWNEYGEGHYLAPHRQYGFGYLDATRAAFCEAPAEHLDLVPQDVGRGPYETLYQAAIKLRAQAAQKVTKPGGDAAGLIAWYTFDDPDPGLALDWTGHQLGGVGEKLHRATGRLGQAMVCDGGAALVAASDAFAPEKGLTIEAWVYTDEAGQNDHWFLSRITSADTAAGFRFGVSNHGQLCFAVPQSSWSHHLYADRPLPTGRWVHVAGTCDGTILRLYQDGELVGTMERRGGVRDTSAPVTLGNFSPGHGAHFDGLLDEVKFWDRALDAATIALHAR